jgi:hypothetical protein
MKNEQKPPDVFSLITILLTIAAGLVILFLFATPAPDPLAEYLSISHEIKR